MLYTLLCLIVADYIFLFIRQDIVYTKWQKTGEEPELASMMDESMSLVAQVTSSDMKLADSFRLWITTQPDSGRRIPGKLSYVI